MKKMKKMTPLNDGFVKIYKIEDISDPGETPKKKLIREITLAYEERIVGMKRYWTAMQASSEISMVIRCHRVNKITTHHIVKLRDGEQYNIKQIQYPQDILPPVMDLSLEKRADKYDISEVVV